RTARYCGAATGYAPPAITSHGRPSSAASRAASGERVMRGNVIETVMGAVVLVVAALFLAFAYKTSQLRSVSGYDVSAEFERVDGIRQGSDVRVSGIKIGSVMTEELDPKTYLATVRMSIDPAIKLPDDTV